METPVRSVCPPSWDLDVVLRYFISSTFEPLSSTPLRSLAKVLFLVALATAKRVGELQAITRYALFALSGACLGYVPKFLAKTESPSHTLPRSFLVKSLADFAAGLDQDLLLCPVRALRKYFQRTAAVVNRSCRLFVSPRSPFRAMSKNVISYFFLRGHS